MKWALPFALLISTLFCQSVAGAPDDPFLSLQNEAKKMALDAGQMGISQTAENDLYIRAWHEQFPLDRQKDIKNILDKGQDVLRMDFEPYGTIALRVIAKPEGGGRLGIGSVVVGIFLERNRHSENNTKNIILVGHLYLQGNVISLRHRKIIWAKNAENRLHFGAGQWREFQLGLTDLVVGPKDEFRPFMRNVWLPLMGLMPILMDKKPTIRCLIGLDDVYWALTNQIPPTAMPPPRLDRQPKILIKEIPPRYFLGTAFMSAAILSMILQSLEASSGGVKIGTYATFFVPFFLEILNGQYKIRPQLFQKPIDRLLIFNAIGFATGGVCAAVVALMGR